MLQLYSIFHLNITYSSIEEEQRPEVIRRCYWPLLRLAEKYNLPFGIEATGYTLETIAAIDLDWIPTFVGMTENSILGLRTNPSIIGHWSFASRHWSF